MAWSADVTTDDLTDYTAFWIAFDAAAARDLFQNVHVVVTLDGKSLSHEMKYMQAAEPYSITCTETGEQFEASRVKYILFLPPLSAEEHVILWTYTITADRHGDAFPDPSGTMAEYKIELRLVS